MNNKLVELLLGRVQEVSQLYLDNVAEFMSGPAFHALDSLKRTQLTTAYFGVTASLGRHTLYVLSVDRRRLDEHLSELFARLAELSGVCRPLGLPPLSFTFNRYRDLLLASGVDC